MNDNADCEREGFPGGWKLVPVEPTPEMVIAAEEAHMPFGDMDIALRMAILSAPSAPRQPEGDHGWLVSLELPEVQCNCAWNPDDHDKTCPVYLRDRMADAQRAIAELREECEHLKDCQENAMLHMTGLVSERDTLREECERLRVFNKSLDEEATKRLQDVIEAENEAHTLRQQLAERDVVAAVTGEDEMLSDALADIATHDKK